MATADPGGAVGKRLLCWFMEGEGEAPRGPEIIMEPAQMAGVWANFAQVGHSEHEFTLDFVRLDYGAPPPGRGIVVARVAVSPLFITQLISALQTNWQLYAEKAMPKEVHGGDDEEPGNGRDEDQGA